MPTRKMYITTRNENSFLEHFTAQWIAQEKYKYPIVDKIIYNLKGKTTIVYFTDGDKVIVRCAEGEEFDKESGLAMAIIRKQFKSRKEFLRLVESGFVQE